MKVFKQTSNHFAATITTRPTQKLQRPLAILADFIALEVLEPLFIGPEFNIATSEMFDGTVALVVLRAFGKHIPDEVSYTAATQGLDTRFRVSHKAQQA